MSDNSRRVADYIITHEAFLQLLLSLDGRTRLRLRGLPADARITGVHSDWEYRRFMVRIESKEHQEAYDGDPVYRYPLEIERQPGSYPEFGPEFFRDSVVLKQIRTIDAEYPAGDMPDTIVRDRRLLLNAYDAAVADNDELRAELATLRAVFGDALQDSAAVKAAWEQGWRDCQRHAALATPNVRHPRRQLTAEEARAVIQMEPGTIIEMDTGQAFITPDAPPAGGRP